MSLVGIKKEGMGRETANHSVQMPEVFSLLPLHKCSVVFGIADMMPSIWHCFISLFFYRWVVLKHPVSRIQKNLHRYMAWSAIIAVMMLARWLPTLIDNRYVSDGHIRLSQLYVITVVIL